MKLRLRHNSIRLRLTQGEVSKLAETKYVEEAIDFGPGSDTRALAYSIESIADSKSVAANFSGGKIRVMVPEAVIRHWAETDDVGISVEIKALNGESLNVLIEKDFTCLKRREGEDKDTFPNPAGVREVTQ